MPTKDELTEQLSVANARIAELEEAAETGGETVTDVAGELLEEGSAYVYTEAGFAVAEAGLSDCYRMKAVVGAEVFDAAVLVVLEEAGEDVNSADDLTDAEMADAVLHVLMRPGTTSDAEENEESDTVAMLRADLQRVTVQRDEARNQRDLAQKRLNDTGTLHGSIDSLPSQV